MLNRQVMVALSMVLTLLLTSCGINESASDEGSSNIRLVQGEALDYTGSQGLVEANIQTGETYFAASGQITAGGEFSLELPESVPADRLLLVKGGLFWEPELTVSDHEAMAGAVHFDVRINDAVAGSLALMSSDPYAPGAKQVSYIFADRNVKVSGTYVSENEEVEVDLNLQRGWNLGVVELIEWTSPTTVRVKVSTGTTVGTSWHFRSY